MAKRLECCGGTGVDDPDWIKAHTEKCLRRLDCGRCGKPRCVWPGGASNMCPSCEATVFRKISGPYRPLSLLLAALLLAAPARSADLQTTRDAAHVGTAFALQTVAYGLTKRALRFEGIEALVFSAMIVGMGTTLFEIVDTGPRDKINTRGIGANLLGIGLSVGAAIAFEF